MKRFIDSETALSLVNNNYDSTKYKVISYSLDGYTYHYIFSDNEYPDKYWILSFKAVNGNFVNMTTQNSLVSTNNEPVEVQEVRPVEVMRTSWELV